MFDGRPSSKAGTLVIPKATEEDIDLISNEVGMFPGGWYPSSVNPEELIAAVLKIMIPRICRATPGKCFCGIHISHTMSD